ncbi:hypothetical protein B0H65DRAFT_421800 [Neurospora tetraspora]|uniref:Uncharacterized protein n=1 Tax=Neurospora tetraspora TaxID=94610 RepID=A0AAE0MVE3_9PEZI|nr:hypothetical protein B0H65DRAFT_421800 [Neurospora tetraspora]
MRLPASSYLSLALLTITTSAGVVKEGSTCIVTPAQAATVKKSIDLTPPPSKRDIDPSSVWEDDDPYAHPAPGSPGALNHFPRPAPSKGSSVHPNIRCTAAQAKWK